MILVGYGWPRQTNRRVVVECILYNWLGDSDSRGQEGDAVVPVFEACIALWTSLIAVEYSDRFVLVALRLSGEC